MPDLPIACTLAASDLQARRTGLLRNLLARARSSEPLSNGHRLVFAASSDVLTAIVAAVDGERQCCRFLRFSLAVEPDGGPVVLDLTGPPGTREFLGRLFGT